MAMLLVQGLNLANPLSNVIKYADSHYTKCEGMGAGGSGISQPLQGHLARLLHTAHFLVKVLFEKRFLGRNKCL